VPFTLRPETYLNVWSTAEADSSVVYTFGVEVIVLMAAFFHCSQTK